MLYAWLLSISYSYSPARKNFLTALLTAGPSRFLHGPYVSSVSKFSSLDTLPHLA